MDHRNINTDRQFKSTTGYSKEEFKELYACYEEMYISENGEKYEDYIKDMDEPPALKTLESSLFFVLFQLKNDLVFDTYGAIFGMNGSTAHNNFKKYRILLEKTLKKKAVYPKREFKSVEEFETHLYGEDDLLFDGTENRIERPQDYDLQKDVYSGKKNCHTDSAMVLSNKKKWIFYLSWLYCGSVHDFGIFKNEFNPEEKWFNKFNVILDLGFVGFDKFYDAKELFIGFKKPRKSKKNPNPPELTKEQKDWNKLVSKKRIYVEHAIGGMKRFRILINRCRLKCYKNKNEIIGVCAALWNFKLHLKSLKIKKN